MMFDTAERNRLQRVLQEPRPMDMLRAVHDDCAAPNWRVSQRYDYQSRITKFALQVTYREITFLHHMSITDEAICNAQNIAELMLNEIDRAATLLSDKVVSSDPHSEELRSCLQLSFERFRHELIRPHGNWSELYQIVPLRKKEQANHRARELLLRFLTPEQRQTFEAQGSFDVTVQRGWYNKFKLRHYRINDQRTNNVQRIVDGEVKEVFCAQPTGKLPLYDVLLAQKLMLEADPATFFSRANRLDRYHYDIFLRRNPTTPRPGELR